MAKKSMNIRYKNKKRERNKYDPTITKDDAFKSTLKVTIGVLVFLGVMYVCVVGMEKLGLFQAGYTAPTSSNSIDYEYINAGTVFTRSEKTYYVMFDDYSTSISYDMYIDTLLNKLENANVYKVDMSKKENSKFASTTSNKKADNANELKINGRTLIKISNGKIKDYVEGSSNIEEYLK